jgi:hypothetical protein
MDMITKIVTTFETQMHSTQQVDWKTEKNDQPTMTFSQGSYKVSANVDSSQILRLQKKMATLDFGRLVMLNEGLGLRRDIILDVKGT